MYQWQSAGGPINYDGTFQTSIAGYPAGAVLEDSGTPGQFYVSTGDNNTTDPETGGAGWLSFNPTQGMQILAINTVAGSSTFTAPAGKNTFYGWCLGAGAGGAGVNTGQSWSGGGGGAGGFAFGFFTLASGSVPTITIGAAGIGGVGGSGGGDGGNGGSSSIGAFMSATGGSGGHSSTAIANVAGGLPGQGTTLGTGVGCAGGYGGSGNEGSNTTIAGGHGGASFIGGGIYSHQTTPPSNIAAFGSGGGGC